MFQAAAYKRKPSTATNVYIGWSGPGQAENGLNEDVRESIKIWHMSLSVAHTNRANRARECVSKQNERFRISIF